MSAITLQQGFAHLTDLPCVLLQYGDYQAVISLYGAQVLSLKHQQHELLWLSPTSQWFEQQPIRGGIPLCWPWFGAIEPTLRQTKVANHGVNHGANHGLVRTRHWQQLADERCADHCLLVLGITLDDVPWHDGPVSLQASFQLDQHGLVIHLHNDELTQQQAALHSYFSCGDVSRVSVTPLPPTYLDKALGGTANQPLQFGGEIDRIYPGSASQLVVQMATPVTLTQGGHDASVVWNPGPIKGGAAADIGENQWSKFVCVETARLMLTNPQPLDLHLRIGLSAS